MNRTSSTYHPATGDVPYQVIEQAVEQVFEKLYHSYTCPMADIHVLMGGEE
jgi:hypothetical protein